MIAPFDYSPEAIARIDAAVRIFLDGGLAPKLGRHAESLAAALLGAELGMSVAASLRTIYFTKDGAPVLFADALLAAIVARGAEVSVLEGTTERVVLEARRFARVLRCSVALIPELREQLPTVVASNYPFGWLRGRAIAILAREAFPDLCLRLYVPEELDLSDRFVRIRLWDVPPKVRSGQVEASSSPATATAPKAPASSSPEAEDEPSIGDVPPVPAAPHPISAATAKLAPSKIVDPPARIVLSDLELEVVNALEAAWAECDLLEELEAVAEGKAPAVATMTDAGKRAAFLAFAKHSDRVRQLELERREADRANMAEADAAEGGAS